MAPKLTIKVKYGFSRLTIDNYIDAVRRSSAASELSHYSVKNKIIPNSNTGHKDILDVETLNFGSDSTHHRLDGLYNIISACFSHDIKYLKGDKIYLRSDEKSTTLRDVFSIDRRQLSKTGKQTMLQALTSVLKGQEAEVPAATAEAEMFIRVSLSFQNLLVKIEKISKSLENPQTDQADVANSYEEIKQEFDEISSLLNHMMVQDGIAYPEFLKGGNESTILAYKKMLVYVEKEIKVSLKNEISTFNSTKNERKNVEFVTKSFETLKSKLQETDVLFSDQLDSIFVSVATSRERANSSERTTVSAAVNSHFKEIKNLNKGIYEYLTQKDSQEEAYNLIKQLYSNLIKSRVNQSLFGVSEKFEADFKGITDEEITDALEHAKQDNKKHMIIRYIVSVAKYQYALTKQNNPPSKDELKLLRKDLSDSISTIQKYSFKRKKLETPYLGISSKDLDKMIKQQTIYTRKDGKYIIRPNPVSDDSLSGDKKLNDQEVEQVFNEGATTLLSPEVEIIRSMIHVTDAAGILGHLGILAACEGVELNPGSDNNPYPEALEKVVSRLNERKNKLELLIKCFEDFVAHSQDKINSGSVEDYALMVKKNITLPALKKQLENFNQIILSVNSIKQVLEDETTVQKLQKGIDDIMASHLDQVDKILESPAFTEKKAEVKERLRKMTTPKSNRDNDSRTMEDGSHTQPPSPTSRKIGAQEDTHDSSAPPTVPTTPESTKSNNTHNTKKTKPKQDSKVEDSFYSQISQFLPKKKQNKVIMGVKHADLQKIIYPTFPDRVKIPEDMDAEEATIIMMILNKYADSAHGRKLSDTRQELFYEPVEGTKGFENVLQGGAHSEYKLRSLSEILNRLHNKARKPSADQPREFDLNNPPEKGYYREKSASKDALDLVYELEKSSSGLISQLITPATVPDDKSEQKNIRLDNSAVGVSDNKGESPTNNTAEDDHNSVSPMNSDFDDRQITNAPDAEGSNSVSTTNDTQGDKPVNNSNKNADEIISLCNTLKKDVDENKTLTDTQKLHITGQINLKRLNNEGSLKPEDLRGLVNDLVQDAEKVIKLKEQYKKFSGHSKDDHRTVQNLFFEISESTRNTYPSTKLLTYKEAIEKLKSKDLHTFNKGASEKTLEAEGFKYNKKEKKWEKDSNSDKKSSEQKKVTLK